MCTIFPTRANGYIYIRINVSDYLSIWTETDVTDLQNVRYYNLGMNSSSQQMCRIVYKEINVTTVV